MAVEAASIVHSDQTPDACGLKQKFQDLVAEWRARKTHSSCVEEMAMNMAYQRIIGLGPDAVPLLPEIAAQYFANPTGSMVTVRCNPWRNGGRVVLLGDACHAVVPFHGQGANAAFEDCVVLDGCLRRHAEDREAAFSSFEDLRRENTDALADLSIANFEEMKHHTGSRLFLIGKSLEKGLHRLFPAWFVPLYMMISFTLTPYAEARRRARRQSRAIALAAATGLLGVVALVLWLSRR